MPEPGESVADAAARYFQEGYNCAQATLRAVAETRGLSCDACIPAVALGMGGGIGHTGRACGALTGGVMAIGLAVDRRRKGDIRERKAEAYRIAGEFVGAFARQFGTADCAAILGLAWSEPGAMDRFRSENMMQQKCVPCVRWAALEACRAIDNLSGAANAGA